MKLFAAVLFTTSVMFVIQPAELTAQPAPKDSLANGARAGAITGALCGSYSALVCNSKEHCNSRQSWAVFGSYTAVGLATGLALDASDNNRQLTRVVGNHWRLMLGAGIAAAIAIPN